MSLEPLTAVADSAVLFRGITMDDAAADAEPRWTRIDASGVRLLLGDHTLYLVADAHTGSGRLDASALLDSPMPLDELAALLTNPWLNGVFGGKAPSLPSPLAQAFHSPALAGLRVSMSKPDGGGTWQPTGIWVTVRLGGQWPLGNGNTIDDLSIEFAVGGPSGHRSLSARGTARLTVFDTPVRVTLDLPSLEVTGYLGDPGDAARILAEHIPGTPSASGSALSYLYVRGDPRQRYLVALCGLNLHWQATDQLAVDGAVLELIGGFGGDMHATVTARARLGQALLLLEAGRDGTGWLFSAEVRDAALEHLDTYLERLTGARLPAPLRNARLDLLRLSYSSRGALELRTDAKLPVSATTVQLGVDLTRDTDRALETFGTVTLVPTPRPATATDPTPDGHTAHDVVLMTFTADFSSQHDSTSFTAKWEDPQGLSALGVASRLGIPTGDVPAALDVVLTDMGLHYDSGRKPSDRSDGKPADQPTSSLLLTGATPSGRILVGHI
ncbi:hypothetical protein CTZ27_35295 [Streptomyces griseocarneus]|nr:hypothetical protein CTZ27_35295 [Streptomyces griseocarneus]